MVTHWHRALLALTLMPATGKGQTVVLPGPETGFFRRIVLAEAPKAAAPDWARLIYLSLANGTDAAYGVKLNVGLLPRGSVPDAAMQALADLQNAADADAVLRQVGATWELLRATESGTVTSLGTARAELSAGQAIRQILGYDAVVLAQQDGVVDALIPEISGQSELYAVALGASAGIAVLKDEKPLKRTALLRLIDSRKVAGYGTLARLKVISSEPGETLPFGTKLRLQP